MAEEGSPTSILRCIKKEIKKTSVICLLIELVLLLITIILLMSTSEHGKLRNFDSHVTLIFSAIIGYMFINSVLIASHFLGEKIPKKTFMMFIGLGGFVVGIAGICLIVDWTSWDPNMISMYYTDLLNQLLTGGILTILASIVYILNTYLIYTYD